MSLPDISLTQTTPAEIDADALVLATAKIDETVVIIGGEALPEEARAALEAMFAGLGHGGKKDEVQRVGPITGIRSPVVILTGLGQSDQTPDALRYAAGAATRRVRGLETVALGLPVTSVADARAVLEGAAMGAYDYTEYRHSTLEGRQAGASSLVLSSALEGADTAIAPALETARAVALVRDLVNAAPLDLYPATLVERAEAAARSLPVTLRVWNEEALEAEGFGGILGVGQGSTRGPRLVRVSYEPSGASRHLALVGKGITFDSGGLSLKPPASMIGMKNDMTGAATVLAVALAAAALALPVRVTAWLCIAENMPSGSAIRPGDVLKIYGGKTVEVLNTDAEGRLVLADGLVAASEEQPDAIIDVATLTGAQVTALGNRYVGVMGDGELVAQVLASATATSETLWHMPMPAELRPLLNSDIADLQNMRPGNTAGGMLIAAIFLREFVGDRADGTGSIPWAHLDIAGPAVNGGEGYGFTGKGPTGVTVRTLLDLAERMSAE
ncbi:leucyl aminopeptidase [Subtercola boreus]|uniref:Probable cytosol aminopeptidase n=1 Tax=Subtercola boreus TaxID=120213 RepID=A0A3E0WBZ7_9MICO|nr:leucyl aminopeptidase [Subtercola boreus]RFA20767.1 leucyl aminopeptidase [Subtercola boreus]RFA20882.1 leucyl aminopeptidase [Subtercola boreus]RFA27075.1 leucyl aminopeptidase [Subtercola boreus]